MESKRSKSAGKLGHQLYCQALAGLNMTTLVDEDFDVLNFKAETGVQLYRVCRGKDNFGFKMDLHRKT